MTKEIRVSQSIFERLQKLATPLVDTPESVIQKLLDHYESLDRKNRSTPGGLTDKFGYDYGEGKLQRRSRQRGIIVKLGGEQIAATSVSDLYFQSMKYLHEHGLLDKLKTQLPLATSRQRYLVATTPVHPNKNRFVVPVEYRGYYMEAHKDYNNGLRHLAKLLDLCGVPLTYSE